MNEGTIVPHLLEFNITVEGPILMQNYVRSLGAPRHDKLYN